MTGISIHEVAGTKGNGHSLQVISTKSKSLLILSRNYSLAASQFSKKWVASFLMKEKLIIHLSVEDYMFLQRSGNV